MLQPRSLKYKSALVPPCLKPCLAPKVPGTQLKLLSLMFDSQQGTAPAATSASPHSSAQPAGCSCLIEALAVSLGLCSCYTFCLKHCSFFWQPPFSSRKLCLFFCASSKLLYRLSYPAGLGPLPIAVDGQVLPVLPSVNFLPSLLSAIYHSGRLRGKVVRLWIYFEGGASMISSWSLKEREGRGQG